MVEHRICQKCGRLKTGKTIERPILWMNPCRCGGHWRILEPDEADELFALKPYDITLHDLILLVAGGINPEFTEDPK